MNFAGLASHAFRLGFRSSAVIELVGTGEHTSANGPCACHRGGIVNKVHFVQSGRRVICGVEILAAVFVNVFDRIRMYAFNLEARRFWHHFGTNFRCQWFNVHKADQQRTASARSRSEFMNFQNYMKLCFRLVRIP
jgi:hypothetical protein